MEHGLVVLGLAAVAYALAASRLDRRSIGAPIVFLVVGLVLGPSVFDLFHPALGSEPVRTLTELTLALVLFTDASTVDLRRAQEDARLPGRLLLIGLPLTIGFGTLAARALFPQVPWSAAALTAAILAPTDAALSLQVVTNRAVPARIRRTLNIESGLNDGIATPFVTFFLAAAATTDAGTSHHWVLDAIGDLAIGIAVAVAVAYVIGRLAARARTRGWTTPTSEQFLVLLMAFLAYGAAIGAGGNGFVAAFVAGLVFGATTRKAFAEPTRFAETVGLFMSFGVWTIFGALFAGPILTQAWDWREIAYAAFSLTLVRMVPVGLSFVRSGMRRDTVAFIGWFGPRGLASVVFTLLAYDSLRALGFPTATLVGTATWTILLSVVLHGLTAGPLSARYGARLQRLRPPPAELADFPEPRLRRRSLTGSPPAADGPVTEGATPTP